MAILVNRNTKTNRGNNRRAYRHDTIKLKGRMAADRATTQCLQGSMHNPLIDKRVSVYKKEIITCCDLGTGVAGGRHLAMTDRNNLRPKAL